jgi:hypothetical protein
MRRRALLAVVVAAALAGGVARAPVASASCAAAVVVDGRVLFGSAVPRPSRLPPRAGTYPAISPACNDTGGDDPDRRTTVQRLRGLPPRVAVAVAGRPDTVYYAEDSLPTIGTHPLHAALFGNPQTPSYREHRRCRRYRTAVRGQVVEAGGLRIRTAERTLAVSVDAATRFTNRPAYEPVLKGQRLRLATSRCGPRRVADRVTFVGTAPAPAAYRSPGHMADSRQLDLAGWQVVLIVLVGSAAGLIGLLWWQLGRAD